MGNLYRRIPKVDLLLEEKELKCMVNKFGKSAVTESIRNETERIRKLVKNGISEEEFETEISDIVDKICLGLYKKETKGFKRVVNATGTILHTNLGRAPISKEHAEKLIELISGYSNLEYDLLEGKRGERYSHFERFICEVTGAESAIAVNNNAAAVLLTLSALACGKEVIVSRGEQVEIGGKFRVPDVIKQGGAELCEVGTTNKTHLSDYENAITENTGLILKVHTSNYRIVGFSDNVSTKELAELSVKKGIPFVEDLGSGIMIDVQKFGIPHEPMVQEVIAAGVDVVCFSGDKLLGGPQAGIIAGKKKYIDKIKKHQLTRALRIDKFTVASLELIWREYYQLRFKEQVEKIPVISLLAKSKEEQKKTADYIAEELRQAADDRYNIEVVPMQSQMGGGTLPLYQFDGIGIVIEALDKIGLKAEKLEEGFRLSEYPVIGRIQNGRFEIHMRTLLEGEADIIIREGKKILTRI